MLLTPIARLAIGAGLATAALWTARRAIRTGRVDQRAEDALDDTDEGLAIHQALGRDQTNAAARFRRTVHFGEHGFEVDAAALARLRIRRV